MFSRIYNILASILGESKQGGYDRNTFQYQFNCPECAEENGGNADLKWNYEVNLQIGRTHCWKCGYSGPISRVVKEYGGTELLKDYYAAVKDIKESKYYNIGLFKDMAENAYMNDYIKLPDTFTKIDLKTCRKKKLVEYLEKRRITQDIIDLHNIGYTTWD
jgi:transcription elongation factor Elf1